MGLAVKDQPCVIISIRTFNINAVDIVGQVQVQAISAVCDLKGY